MPRTRDEVPDKGFSDVHNPKFNAQNRLVNGALDDIGHLNKSPDVDDKGMDRNLNRRG